jgi:hypothetical protein
MTVPRREQLTYFGSAIKNNVYKSQSHFAVDGFDSCLAIENNENVIG